MTQATLSFRPEALPPAVPWPTVLPVLGAWFALIFWLAVSGAFSLNVAGLPWVTLTAILAPPALFGLGLAVSPRVKAFALSLNPAFVTSLQGWRIVGAMFVALYAFDQLPGLFAWPAGVGDAAVGVVAPFVVWRLLRQPATLGSPGFRWFHYAGLFDFFVAVATGIAAREAIPGLVEGATSAAMGEFPLTMIPTYFVPLFIILHMVALLHSFRAARTG